MWGKANTKDNRPNAKKGGTQAHQSPDSLRKWICHSLLLPLQSWCPMRCCKCQRRQDKLAHCRWHQASQPHLAFSRAALPEETAQLYPPIKDFYWLTWHCRWMFLCKNVHHYMQDYINLSCLSVPGASMVQAFPTMLLDIVKNYQSWCLKESFCIQQHYIVILPQLIQMPLTFTWIKPLSIKFYSEESYKKMKYLILINLG